MSNQTETPNGAEYVARVRLSDREDRTTAAVGETCEHVDPASLPWLIADGLIVHHDAAIQETSAHVDA